MEIKFTDSVNSEQGLDNMKDTHGASTGHTYSIKLLDSINCQPQVKPWQPLTHK